MFKIVFGLQRVGRHVNVEKLKSLEIQAYYITNEETFWGENLSDYQFLLAAPMLHKSKNTERSIIFLLDFLMTSWENYNYIRVENDWLDFGTVVEIGSSESRHTSKLKRTML